MPSRSRAHDNPRHEPPPPPGDRLRLPLPPVRSGIADYSVDLLPALCERADVRVLALPGQPVDQEVVERFGVVSAEPERLPLYQMGNNRYHEAVEALALAHPGVLTLHDFVLHHLASEEHLSHTDFVGYRRRLEADHGWIGTEAARPREWGAEVGAMLFELPAHRTLLRRQRGVLVHNRWAAERLAEEDPKLRVRVVPMGVPLPAAADQGAGRAFRRRLGIPDGSPVLGSFGFQTPIKRTFRAVEALAAPELAAVHLLVVGESPRVPAPGGELGRARSAGPRARRRRSGPRDRLRPLGGLRGRDRRLRPLPQPALPDRRRDLGVAAARARGRTAGGGLRLRPVP